MFRPYGTVSHISIVPPRDGYRQLIGLFIRSAIRPDLLQEKGAPSTSDLLALSASFKALSFSGGPFETGVSESSFSGYGRLRGAGIAESQLRIEGCGDRTAGCHWRRSSYFKEPM